MLALLCPGVGMGGGGSPAAEVALEWGADSWALEWQQGAWAMLWGADGWAGYWGLDVAVITDITVHKGAAASLVFSPRDGAQDVSAWPLRLDVSRPVDQVGGAGTPVLTLATSGSGITGSALGVITAAITRAQSLALGSGRFLYTLTRSDTGAVLAEGRLTVKAVARE